MEAKITIDTATLADIDQILEIEKLSFDSDRFSKQQFSYLISKAKGRFYVLRYEGKIMAYISLTFNQRTCLFRIYSIAVHPEGRGKNLAQQLIAKATEYAREKGAKAMTLEVKTTNLAAIRLYEKNGFTKTSVKHRYYTDGEDAYSMRLIF
ncbi:MAG: ribosomal protein S18-alanine N-acetyltransferase [Bacteroidales bacterium]|jgi:ribosomal-protein-alanine acetyltransferase|nr:ribosomal protein S18-alanine N-acetyltransferase [Bacteroidales bacterium]